MGSKQLSASSHSLRSTCHVIGKRTCECASASVSRWRLLLSSHEPSSKPDNLYLPRVCHVHCASLSSEAILQLVCCWLLGVCIAMSLSWLAVCSRAAITTSAKIAHPPRTIAIIYQRQASVVARWLPSSCAATTSRSNRLGWTSCRQASKQPRAAVPLGSLLPSDDENDSNDVEVGVLENQQASTSKAAVAESEQSPLRSIDMSSTVHRGTAYEQLCIETFHGIGMQLSRSGGAGDNGIDFHGSWTSSNAAASDTIGIIGQCKKERAAVGPVYVREFEGTIHRAQRRQASDTTTRGASRPLLGIYVAYAGFTPSAHTLAYQSPFPMVLCEIDDDGDIVHMKPNTAARRLMPSNLVIGVSHKAHVVGGKPSLKKVVAVVWRT